MATLEAMPGFTVVMSGGLSRLKEFRSELTRKDLDARVLPPEDGCIGT